MLSISVSGLARPLKSRILQVVASLARRTAGTDHDEDDDDDEVDEADYYDRDEGHIVRTRVMHLYEIGGLLLFYAAAMEKSQTKLQEPDAPGPTEEPNPVIASVLECLTETTQAYEGAVRVYAALLGQLTTSTGDSEARLTSSLLALISDVRMNSPGYSSDVFCPENCRTVLSLEWITSTLVEAALQNCQSLDDIAELQQSLNVTKKAGLSIICAEQLDRTMETKQQGLLEQLIEAETAKVLDVCGLGSITTAHRKWQRSSYSESGEAMAALSAMASYPGLSPAEVQVAMKQFYASLYSPPLPLLTLIRDPVARKASRSRIASRVCEIYHTLHDAITAEHGGYEDTAFLNYTPSQVLTLFKD
jgi:conserved oligomeric Golgi complex subunit 6